MVRESIRSDSAAVIRGRSTIGDRPAEHNDVSKVDDCTNVAALDVRLTEYGDTGIRMSGHLFGDGGDVLPDNPVSDCSRNQ